MGLLLAGDQKRPTDSLSSLSLPLWTMKVLRVDSSESIRSESQDSTAKQIPFKKRSRSHPCDLRRLSCTTHYHAAVPMHKQSQHMQNTIAQHQQRRKTITWNLQFHYARKSNRNRRQNQDGRTGRASNPTFLHNGTHDYPKKTQWFMQILRFKSHP